MLVLDIVRVSCCVQKYRMKHIVLYQNFGNTAWIKKNHPISKCFNSAAVDSRHVRKSVGGVWLSYGHMPYAPSRTHWSLVNVLYVKFYIQPYILIFTASFCVHCLKENSLLKIGWFFFFLNTSCIYHLVFTSFCCKENQGSIERTITLLSNRFNT